MAYIVGFTGTRNGMTPDQNKALYLRVFAAISQLYYDNVAGGHGDCVGADAEFHDAFVEVFGHPPIIYPPIDEKLRAFKKSKEIRKPKTHFARNRDIVDECSILIATPLQMERQDRGGTWYTIDYAVKKKTPVIVILPDGTIKRNRDYESS